MDEAEAKVTAARQQLINERRRFREISHNQKEVFIKLKQSYMKQKRRLIEIFEENVALNTQIEQMQVGKQSDEEEYSALAHLMFLLRYMRTRERMAAEFAYATHNGAVTGTEVQVVPIDIFTEYNIKWERSYFGHKFEEIPHKQNSRTYTFSADDIGCVIQATLEIPTPLRTPDLINPLRDNYVSVQTSPVVPDVQIFVRCLEAVLQGKLSVDILVYDNQKLWIPCKLIISQSRVVVFDGTKEVLHLKMSHDLTMLLDSRLDHFFAIGYVTVAPECSGDMFIFLSVIDDPEIRDIICICLRVFKMIFIEMEGMSQNEIDHTVTIPYFDYLLYLASQKHARMLKEISNFVSLSQSSLSTVDWLLNLVDAPFLIREEKDDDHYEDEKSAIEEIESKHDVKEEDHIVVAKLDTTQSQHVPVTAIQKTSKEELTNLDEVSESNSNIVDQEYRVTVGGTKYDKDGYIIRDKSSQLPSIQPDDIWSSDEESSTFKPIVIKRVSQAVPCLNSTLTLKSFQFHLAPPISGGSRKRKKHKKKKKKRKKKQLGASHGTEISSDNIDFDSSYTIQRERGQVKTDNSMNESKNASGTSIRIHENEEDDVVHEQATIIQDADLLDDYVGIVTLHIPDSPNADSDADSQSSDDVSSDD